jgi:hypothetical protein
MRLIILQLSVQNQELPAVLQGEQAAALHVPRCQDQAGEELRAPRQDPRSDAPHRGSALPSCHHAPTRGGDGVLLTHRTPYPPPTTPSLANMGTGQSLLYVHSSSFLFQLRTKLTLSKHRLMMAIETHY